MTPCSRFSYFQGCLHLGLQFTVYVLIFANCLKCTQEIFSLFRKVKSAIFLFSAHSVCTCQYECDNVLDGFWGPGDGCQSDTGSETVPGQIFASIIFRGLGFIQENLYTAKISMYTVCLLLHA